MIIITTSLLVVALYRHSWSHTSAAEQPSRWARLGTEISRLVHEKFYDRKAADAWFARNRGYSNAIRERAVFITETNRRLSELKTSHTHYYTEEDPTYFGLANIFENTLHTKPMKSHILWDSIGADIRSDGYVQAVFARSAAERGGILRGDRIVAANGQPFHVVRSFAGQHGRPVVLTVQRGSAEAPLRITVRPVLAEPKQEWLDAERFGATVHLKNGKRIGFIPLISGAGEAYQDLMGELITGPLADADALVIDLRNGFGGCNPSFVNLFNPAAPELTMTDRSRRRNTFRTSWRKPLYLIVNGGTRSGKEVVAYALQRSGRAKLVGEATAGAVAAGSCFALSDGSILYLAVADILVDGIRLEGRGAEPDVLVQDRLENASGHDIQKERAIELATQ